MRKYIIALGFLLTSSLCMAEPYSVSSHTRETDYTIGSVARQNLEVDVPLGYRLDEGSLPEKGLTEAVELRDIHWHFSDEKNVTHYSFEVDWQIFVAFDTVKSVPLRNLTLVFRRDDHTFSIEVPPDSVLVSNLLPPQMDSKHVQPYHDVTAQFINTTPLIIKLLLSLVLLVSTLTYIAWYFGLIAFPVEKRMPFRQAWREIRNLKADEQQVSSGLLVISRAFNEYAGYSVTTENLPLLLDQRAKLQPLSNPVTQLYHDIQQYFFAGKSPRLSFNELKKLAKQLSVLELP